MSELVITARNVGKEYAIGEMRHNTLRDQIVHGFMGWLRRSDQPTERARRFQALKDVSFEVNEGELLAIIGRNGAGKSTLLKILSRITDPTCGEIDV